MTPESNNWKYATIILGIVAVILLGVLFARKDETVSDTFTNINDRLANCRLDIAEWSEANSTNTTVTPEARENLDAILARCLEGVEESREQI